MTLPKLALSVRQPWAWAIIHAGKDIENRSWRMAQGEYWEAANFMRSIGVGCPPPADILRGGIVGSVEVIDVVSKSDSLWFFGPRGLVLRDPQPCEFVPCLGALGYFAWKLADASLVPARWMLPKEEKSASLPLEADPQEKLL